MTRAVDIEERGVQVNGRSVGVGSAIPDSVVSRPQDDSTFSTSSIRGIKIVTTAEWSQIGARISNNCVGHTRARVLRVSDGQLMGSTDVSGISSGDTFTIDLDINLVSGETYSFVLDADGATYTQGFTQNTTYPYSSSDGNLSIVAGAAGSDGLSDDSQGSASNINDVGDTGF